MRRLASEVLRELETRVARLEKQAGPQFRGIDLGFRLPENRPLREDVEFIVERLQEMLPSHQKETKVSWGRLKRDILKVLNSNSSSIKKVEAIYRALENNSIDTTWVKNSFEPIYYRQLAKKSERKANMRLARLERTSSRWSTDEDVIHELELSIINESRLYPMIQQIISNQARHMIKGRWSEQGAIKAFENLVVAGIKMYRKEHGNYILPSRISRSVKQAVAKTLFEYYEDNINEAVEDLA